MKRHLAVIFLVFAFLGAAIARTPTLYIDGRLAPPLHSQQDLQHLLVRELQDQSARSAAEGK